MQLAFGSRAPRIVLIAAALLITFFACRGEPPPSPLTSALKQEGAVDWPLSLGPLPAARQACKTDYCMAGDALDLVLNRAADWMADYDKELKFDAAIGLSQTRRIVSAPQLERAWSKAMAVADADDDHPHRRFWMPEMRSPAEHTSAWEVPAGGARVNPNRVLSEALHCKENGWRPQTTAYVCTSMRDDGGYHTAHALWALDIARDAGCVDDSVSACFDDLEKELAQAQPRELQPATTLEVDLYAERLLMLLLAGYEDPALHTWAKNLIGAQQADGSWGVAAEEDPYYRYHATNAATWALAEWLRFLVRHPGRATTLGALQVHAPHPIGGAPFWGCAFITG